MDARMAIRSLAVAIVAAAAPAHADAVITGSAAVPGQPGEVDYDIRAKKTDKENEFQITVTMRPKKGDKTPDKKFFICMMFQLNKRCFARAPGLTSPPRKGERRYNLKKVPCWNTPPESEKDADGATRSKDPPSTCWCCEPTDPDVGERMSYHLGCREVQLKEGENTIPFGPGVGPDNGIVQFKDLVGDDGQPCHIDESDIESFYWDTFLGGDTANDKDAMRWVTSCQGAHYQGMADPAPEGNNLCPGVVGQDTSMGPPPTQLGPLNLPSPARIKGILGIGAVNIWAMSFATISNLKELGCTISRGQAVRHVAPETPLYKPPPVEKRVSMAAPRPIRPIQERCGVCDGENHFCWLGTAPLDNFWTMRWRGEYPARLGGTLVGPPFATVTVIVPGQVDHQYTTDAQGKVFIDESYVIGRDSMRPDNDLQMFVVAGAGANIGEGMRFDGEVVAGPNNPAWEEGVFMHKVTFSPPLIEEVGRPEKRWMVNVDLGGDFEIYNEPNQFVVGAQVGYRVLADRRAYLMLVPEVKVAGNLATLILPAAFQWEFGLPVANLYVYPRLGLGYAASFASTVLPPELGGTRTQTFHYGVITGAGGLKYVINDRWNVALEPVGFTLFFNGDGSSMVYRLTALGGVNF